MKFRIQTYLSVLLLFWCVGQTQAIVVSTGIIAGVYIKSPATLTVDDWNDGAKPNNIGGSSGAFDGGAAGKASEVIVSTVANGAGCSCEISYNVNADYSGFWMDMRTSGTRNLSSYSAMSFYVKGSAGNEYFKVELKSGGKVAARYIVSGYLAAVTTSWQKVTIPLTHFIEITDWTTVSQFTVVFEHDQSAANGSPLSGKIYIDDLSFIQ